MNWAAIGAIGEVLGAVAVVATLLYVARQLDEQGRALTTSVRDSAFQQLQEWNYQVMADPGLSHLFQRGAASDDWSGFSPEERSRLIHVLYSFFKTFENIYVHRNDRRGALDERFVDILEGMGEPTMPTGLQMTKDGSGTTLYVDEATDYVAG
jgi:hypothetical protein